MPNDPLLRPQHGRGIGPCDGMAADRPVSAVGVVPDDQDMNARTMALTDARCAIRWGTTEGVAQLAATGPTKESRIGATSQRGRVSRELRPSAGVRGLTHNADVTGLAPAKEVNHE